MNSPTSSRISAPSGAPIVASKRLFFFVHAVFSSSPVVLLLKSKDFLECSMMVFQNIKKGDFTNSILLINGEETYIGAQIIFKPMIYGMKQLSYESHSKLYRSCHSILSILITIFPPYTIFLSQCGFIKCFISQFYCYFLLDFNTCKEFIHDVWTIFRRSSDFQLFFQKT